MKVAALVYVVCAVLAVVLGVRELTVGSPLWGVIWLAVAGAWVLAGVGVQRRAMRR